MKKNFSYDLNPLEKLLVDVFFIKEIPVVLNLTTGKIKTSIASEDIDQIKEVLDTIVAQNVKKVLRWILWH